MMQDNKKGKDNTIAHVAKEQDRKESSTYDPDRYESQGADFEEGIPLEEQAPDKGYSTDARQGKEAASLHLADEDMDRRPENPVARAEELKESYKKSKKNSDIEKAKEELKKEKDKKE